MDATELRPLTLGELLDRTFRLYRNNFWLFAGIMAIPSAFSIPFGVVVFSMQGSALSAGPPSPKLLAGVVLFALAFMCLFSAVYAVAIGATTFAVSEAYLGQKISVRDAYRKVRGNFWRIIGVVVVALIRAYAMLIVFGIGIATAVLRRFGTTTGLASPFSPASPLPCWRGYAFATRESIFYPGTDGQSGFFSRPRLTQSRITLPVRTRSFGENLYWRTRRDLVD